jgi:pimeloyl-ACP methyl ester carboxylesterase
MSTLARNAFVAMAAVGTAIAQDSGKTTSSEPLVDGSGAPIVMVGGGTRGAGEFAPHVPLLARTWRVIRIQTLNIICARDHLPLPPGYSVKVESKTLAQSLDRLNVQAADFVGHSYGALVLLDFALDHPDRVRSLTLAEPPAFWVVSAAELRTSKDMWTMYQLSLTLKPGIEPTDDQLVRFLCALGNCSVAPPSRSESERQEWDFRRAALRGLAAVANHSDDINRVRKFNRPVLIVTGQNTVSFHRRIDDILAAEFPSTERLTLPGGHGAVASAPQQFVNGLTEFLRRRF